MEICNHDIYDIMTLRNNDTTDWCLLCDRCSQGAILPRTWQITVPFTNKTQVEIDV